LNEKHIFFCGISMSGYIHVVARTRIRRMYVK
jgi:hypothetical protein